MDKVKLLQKSKTGKTKILEIWTDGAHVIRRWGLEGHKMQVSGSTCEGKNIGKKNETTPSQQAEIEALAIIVKKKHEGYCENGVSDISASATLDFENLQSSFAPSKPFTEPPKDFEKNMGEYCAERKNNGVCLIMVRPKVGPDKTFTRGMREITHIVNFIEPIINVNTFDIPKGSILLYEFIYYNKDGKEVPKELRGLVNERTTAEKATKRYKELLATGGSFATKVFDILVLDSKNVSNLSYIERRAMLEKYIWSGGIGEQMRSTYFDIVNRRILTQAKAAGWEGLILRKKTGPDSTVEYTLNGKPSRKGAWKYVFEKTSDFIVTEIQLGDSGRLQGLPARFHLAQWDGDSLVDCSWAGPGKLSTEDLELLKQELGLEDKITTTSNLVVEVIYRNRSEETNALEFPVIQRLRNDKPTSECLLGE